jgi:hypothetical protein
VAELKLDFAVSGLGCGGGGAGALERALAGLGGVARVYVNPLTERAYLEYDPCVIKLKPRSDFYPNRETNFRQLEKRF